MVRLKNKKKNEFLDYFQEYLSSCTLPWLPIGDFNEMLTPKDKICGQGLSPNNLRRLLELLNVTDSVDVPTIQPSISWCVVTVSYSIKVNGHTKD